ncbi:Hypothetical Protein RSKD131_4024 [Cereibacter sphaeroides KD131]|nr:Hypothetical Protein RSKD131_4024 [Cereibacter sphaeroides KD131]
MDLILGHRHHLNCCRGIGATAPRLAAIQPGEEGSAEQKRPGAEGASAPG